MRRGQQVMRRAGERRHLVQIQHLPSSEQHTGGQPVLDWTTIATRWARVTPLSGREYFAAQQNVSEVTTEVEMDYFPGLNAAMRLLVEGVYLEIKDTIDVEFRHITHLVMCSSGVVVNA